MSVCVRCGAQFNAWSISFPKSPFGGANSVCQKCRARPQRGEKRPLAKLTEYDVIQIRRRHAEGESQKSLAREYGVDPSTIKQVRLRRAWTHVA